MSDDSVDRETLRGEVDYWKKRAMDAEALVGSAKTITGPVQRLFEMMIRFEQRIADIEAIRARSAKKKTKESE